MTRAAQLKVLLKGRSVASLIGLATVANVDPIIARRAGKGQAISFEHFLRLCGALGRDPCNLDRARALPVGRFRFRVLAADVSASRKARGENMREFAKATNLSVATICRLEGRTVGFGTLSKVLSTATVLTMCEFLGRHPFDFVSVTVKRETITETRRAA